MRDRAERDGDSGQPATEKVHSRGNITCDIRKQCGKKCVHVQKACAASSNYNHTHYSDIYHRDKHWEWKSVSRVIGNIKQGRMITNEGLDSIFNTMLLVILPFSSAPLMLL